jgi:hypothetical protein
VRAISVLPLPGLYSCGVAHVAVPSSLLADLREVEDVATLEPVRAALDEVVAGELGILGLPLRLEASTIRRLDGEGNPWHYDTDQPGWCERGSITAADRQSVLCEPVRCVLPFPAREQPPSVVVPWGGPLAGLEVQAPAGYLTLILGRITWHRADGRPGWRARYTRDVVSK